MIELIGVIVLTVSPWFLKVMTNFAKRAESIRFEEDRKFLIRFALAVLSFIVAVVHAMLSGEPLPDGTVESFVDGVEVFVTAGLIWLATTGLYLFQKKDK